MQTTQAGLTKTFIYDINGSVAAEYEATGGATGYGVLRRLNIYSGGKLLAVDEVQTDGTKQTSYVMADRHGSTTVLMDAAGAVTSRHDYLPFGEELGAGTGAPGSPSGMRTASQGYGGAVYGAADSAPIRYAGTRFDETTGLDHTLWRKLETRSGRWTTPDPYGHSMRVSNPQSFNRYAYVHNDPVNLADPRGLCTGADGDCVVTINFSFDSPLEGGGGSGGSEMGLVELRPRPLGEILPLDPPNTGVFDDAYRDCKSSLGTAAAPGLVQAAAIVQAANSTGVDRTLLAFTWYEESGGFNFHPKNGLHVPGELVGDIGPGQLFPGIWDKSPFNDGLDDPFGTNREVDQVFNGDPVENLILTGRALNHPLGAVQGDRRAEAAGLYKAGSRSGPGYQTRVDKWNKANVKGYDDFFGCLKNRGF